jgi:8-oxo-dGTP pyrophosphatase MutT (NUDIX family)
MTIFLDHRIIRLLKQPPLRLEGICISDYHRLEEIYLDFENSPEKQELILWAEDHGKLKKHFFSLFKILKAAGGVVGNETGEILFIFRRGRWDLPKGKIERISEHRSETPAQAALREVAEETGLTHLTIVRKLHPTFHIYDHRNTRILKKTQWYKMLAPGNQRIRPQTEEDISEIKWFPAGDLHIPLGNTYASLKGLITEIF